MMKEVIGQVIGAKGQADPNGTMGQDVGGIGQGDCVRNPALGASSFLRL